MKEYPLVSIVTPSFQQAKFIEETIESVRAQTYPNIEHIVVDGGSTDGTVDTLKRLSCSEDRFRWISEQDRGQSNAINKGLKMAQGEIIGWLNSDDTYEPHAVELAVTALQEHESWGMVYGKADYTDEKSRFIRPYPVEPFERQRLYEGCIICQPAAFMRKHVMDELGGIDEYFHFCMDYELWMRISNHYPVGFIPELLAHSRLHDESKTMTQYFQVGLPEIIRASVKNFGSVSEQWLSQYYVHAVLLEDQKLWDVIIRSEPIR
ncbi:glycosyltransferase family 2 protein [Paenibacillus caui]|uniref:glycosyltransferase family 2 protein n=1 Tax=Paenibacillus caui TaxID=2873927 RepID=UPI001CA9965F|nr:glycosyltransferase family 2 protein [Paenibacillus caui]